MIEATTRCLSAVVLGTAMLVGAVRAEAAEIQYRRAHCFDARKPGTTERAGYSD